jgi:murein DD-endopeptidase MepM/ murein hydrolase activator NlpD
LNGVRKYVKFKDRNVSIIFNLGNYWIFYVSFDAKPFKGRRLMIGFRGIRWTRDLLKGLKVKWQGLNETNADRLDSSNIKETTLTVIKKHKWTLVYAVSALTLAGSIVIGGNHYVANHIVEVYHVKLGQQEIGIVSNQELIDHYKAARPIEVQKNNPNVHMMVETDSIHTVKDITFHAEIDDQAVITALNEKLIPYALGVQLKVDGKVVAIVKDQRTADQILEQLKAPYRGTEKESGKVSTLAAGPAEIDITTAPSELDRIDFVQKVETAEVPIVPHELDNPDDVVKLLQTGNMQPTKYTVVEGDCVSCIAKKLNISKQIVYDNNPTVQDDKLKIGQVLDLTVLKPAVTVKTVERVVQNQEIQYDTEYVKDDSMRAGVVEPISPGKNGLKKVTIQVTKINGMLTDDHLLSEEIIDKPVTAKVKKGTKVILGEGSGKFSWPVVSASISSTFGYRWGKLHKGVDITGNRNILAADNGKVVETGYKDDYGNYIIINHMNGYQTLYGHLSKITITDGSIVEKGEKIGIMGSTGDSTGVHLHFEIHNNGGLENPLKYLNR